MGQLQSALHPRRRPPPTVLPGQKVRPQPLHWIPAHPRQASRVSRHPPLEPQRTAGETAKWRLEPGTQAFVLSKYPRHCETNPSEICGTNPRTRFLKNEPENSLIPNEHPKNEPKPRIP